ncbi:hypothetical protein ACN23B_01020 [Anabaena sp. FACHB-709]|uniref:Uncharacterized protein n=2 Tax=Nostocaceae TaxID=1162 RepID=A0A1Z4KQ85_ANAVA|nr:MULTISPECIES: hypothetical protein [Nostocaceae]BAY71175.1 hypothetical protein NIES23_39910 [Trichormus variabilis NIES-23]MBD2171970.1 hypothetical protein [Anabaena cylindrica FACHB-318]MBD2263548.1 hypothetical protein [Anabaena sp. FACHB-709]MBD2273092.1 hypothetical protein [Nostoc sp. PCC 7120 = FACHB-418]MBD2284010.1 hypothetical protein [Anabaena cylindrica FACHB-170]
MNQFKIKNSLRQSYANKIRALKTAQGGAWRTRKGGFKLVVSTLREGYANNLTLTVFNFEF